MLVSIVFVNADSYRDYKLKTEELQREMLDIDVRDYDKLANKTREMMYYLEQTKHKLYKPTIVVGCFGGSVLNIPFYFVIGHYNKKIAYYENYYKLHRIELYYSTEEGLNIVPIQYLIKDSKLKLK
jgi:hypothetical protein